MSIQIQLNRITKNIKDSYSVLKAGGVSLPAQQNSDNLPEAIKQLANSGGGDSGGYIEAPEKDVNFIDFNGKVFKSYTFAEAAALTSLPEGPKHKGLIFQEWNHTLEEIKQYNYTLYVGSNFITESGKTYIILEIIKETQTLVLGLGLKGTVNINWGDGTPEVSVTGDKVSHTAFTQQHTFASPGRYIVTIDPLNSELSFGDDDWAASQIIRKGPTDETDLDIFLSTIREIYLGKNFAELRGSNFRKCFKLKTLTLPKQIGSIASSCFIDCEQLESLHVPHNVNLDTTKYFCKNCRSMKFLTFPSTTKILMKNFIEDGAFTKVTIPIQATEIGEGSFSGNYFNDCLKFPSTIKIIGQEAFYKNEHLRLMDFSTHTEIPTLGANALKYTNSSLKILVPKALEASWKAATNWASYASNIQGV